MWIRRDSDRLERFFFNRPRLQSEFKDLFRGREERYRKFSTHVLTLSEGDGVGGQWNSRNEVYLQSCGILEFDSNFSKGLKNWGFTLLPEEIHWDFSRLRPGFIEVRNDIFKEFQIPQSVKLPKDIPLLKSFRVKDESKVPEEMSLWDWDIKLGIPPEGRSPTILSSHPSAGETRQAMDELTRIGGKFPGSLLKLAPRVDSWKSLEEGETWRKRDPLRRAFLPISPDDSRGPLWTWHRLYRGFLSPLNFFRLGVGSSVDQPTLLELRMLYGLNFDNFGAVLGEGVQSSWSPVEHQSYLRIPYFRIPVSRGDLPEAEKVLDKMGMVLASLTSPHKIASLELSGKLSHKSSSLNSVNTWVKSMATSEWLGESTDLEGLRILVEKLPLKNFSPGEIAVWGGGGMRGPLKAIFPQATFFSARTGQMTEGPPLVGPKLMVWAAGQNSNFPPEHWSRPEFLMDLSYGAHSMALKYAGKLGLKADQVIQGDLMFSRQAALQREIWNSHGFVCK